MVRNDARFHLVMMLAETSNRIANTFNRDFEHSDKQRSSNRTEMMEINEWWARELKRSTAVGADAVLGLTVDRGVDVWIKQFRSRVLPYIIRHWDS